MVGNQGWIENGAFKNSYFVVAEKIKKIFKSRVWIDRFYGQNKIMTDKYVVIGLGRFGLVKLS